MGQMTGVFGYALNTIAASGADVASADGKISFTPADKWSFIYNDIIIGSATIQAYVAPVGRITTLLHIIPAAVGELYSVNIEQPQADGSVLKQQISVVSATGDTAALMAAKMNTAINAYITAGIIAGTSSVSTATVTTTGLTTAPMLRIVSATTNITVTATTAGTVEVNSGTQLYRDFPGIVNLVTTNNYSTARFKIKNYGEAVNNEGGTTWFIYAMNEGDADYAALVTKIGEYFNGFNAGAVTANPALISIA
jgi:hypothetical protein